MHVFLKTRGGPIQYRAKKVGDGHVRLMTWNVKHYGAKPTLSLRDRDAEAREHLQTNAVVHDRERALNLVEIIF